jgi:ABC-type amino acid transport substrate-binding protein
MQGGLMNLLRGAFALSLLLPLLLSSCESGGDPNASDAYADLGTERLAQIKASSSFKVAVRPKPPFAVKDAKGFSGIEVEMVAAIAKELNLKPQFFEVSENSASAILRDGGADLLCGGYDEPSIVRQFLTPTLKYMPSEQRVVISVNMPSSVNNWRQLDNEKTSVLTIVGSSSSRLSESLFPKAKHLMVPNFEKALEELKIKEKKKFSFFSKQEFLY